MRAILDKILKIYPNFKNKIPQILYLKASKKKINSCPEARIGENIRFLFF
jgi:hypothetical protein